jgi:hypothetical protein
MRCVPRTLPASLRAKNWLISGKPIGEDATMQDRQFEYRGHIVDISVRQPSAESDTGVYLTTIRVTPTRADGSHGDAMVLEKNSQGIFLSEADAHEAAEGKTRTYLDRLGADE